MNSSIIGISCGYHDSAAVLIDHGEIVAAAQEERFTRIKQDSRFPENALRWCLNEGKCSLDDVRGVFYYENPQLKLSRIAQTYLNFGWAGTTSFLSEMPAWLTGKLDVRGTMQRELRRIAGSDAKLPPIEYVEHHRSHAAAAFYPSGFDQAAVLCVDGVGEWATTSAWVGNGRQLEPLWDIRFPHSLGLLYSAITYFCGFKVDSGEYKLMGLAPYGRPTFENLIRKHLIDLKPDGSFWLNMDYFDYAVGDCMISERMEHLFGGPRRTPEGLLTQREFDLAASVQAVLEDALQRIALTLRRQTGLRDLCMAGGVALNCVSNGKLLAQKTFDRIWVQPASGDSGGALGAALSGLYGQADAPHRPTGNGDQMKGSLLGSWHDDVSIERQLSARKAVYRRIDDGELCPMVADLLAQGQVVGWFQGRMEFGPRSLGSRSILGDARNSTMQRTMNLKIKNRESFRPFAPAVLEEHVGDWFDIDRASPYMLFVVPVQPSKRKALPDGAEQLKGIDLLNCVRSHVPAITHVDYSARVQTVDRTSNPRFRALIERFHERTGCPVVVNTSFNVRGEPIVESPDQAYLCFMRTQMDALVVGNYVMLKADQPPFEETADWRHEFALD